jgi:ABC-type iron transport system FetAB ATPase subunit
MAREDRRSAQRLDELRAQAQYARQRRDLYKAKAYGPRMTSPVRMRELEREHERALAALEFAELEARRELESRGHD